MDNRLEIKLIPINDLVYDPNNPRLPSSLRRRQNEPTYESEVIDWMLQFENVTELMGSIGEKGFFPAEPLLAVLNAAGKYEVVEGNRRLTAVKLLNKPELATVKKKTVELVLAEANANVIPDKIPTLTFETREETLAYLGYKHITGVQAWDSLAKAKYLKQLFLTLSNQDSFYERCKTLAKIIGSKANYVRLLLIGADIFNILESKNFYNITNLREENFEFGVFYTALGRSNISKFVGVDFESETPIKDLKEENLEYLTRWVFEENAEGFTRLGESRNLTKLDKILDNAFPRALTAFKEQGKSLDEASRLTDHPSEIFQNSLNDSLSSLEIARNYLHEIDTPLQTHADSLKEISQLARDLSRLVTLKMIDSEESGD